MAIRHNPKPAQLLDASAAKRAGAFSILLALLSAAAIVAYLVHVKGGPPLLTALGVAKIAILALMAAAGVQLIRQRSWAQRFLLIVWLAALIGAVTLSVVALLWGTPAWWNFYWPPAAVLPAVVALEALAVVMLARASAAGSRLRYGTYVAVSGAAAIALAIVVNMFSQKDYFRADVESLRRFSLSDRTKKILDAVDTPVTLTCVYTSSDEKSQTPLRRARVLELLNEMREHNPKVTVVNVGSDVEKLALVGRLRARRERQATEHIRLLESFQKAAARLSSSLETQEKQWRGVAGKSYLDLWGLTADVVRLLGGRSRSIARQADVVKGKLATPGLVDYEKLTDEVKETLTSTDTALAQLAGTLKQLRKIPAAVKANRDEALTSADAGAAAVKAMADALGKKGAEPPADPPAVLKGFSQAAEKASRQINLAARALEEVAGKDYSTILRASQAWLVKTNDAPSVVTSDGMVLSLGRETVTDLYADAAKGISELKLTAETYLREAKTDSQVRMINKLRQDVAALSASLAAARAAAEAAIDTLAKVDPPTEALMAKAGDKAFESIRKPIAELLGKIDVLPKLEADTLADEITGENIVIVEAGHKSEVVDFETVWPLKVQQFGAAEGAQKRLFDGDSAISSKILSLTHEPFATVLITYFRPQVPPQMRRFAPQLPLSPMQLTTLKERLEEANFEVVEWNLSEEMPDLPEGRQAAMLVLPPPISSMGMFGPQGPPPFGPEQLRKITDAIDSGTPAIFLCVPLPQVPIGPEMAQYLREDWGIDMKVDHIVIPAVADSTRPDKFKIAPERFTHLPLSNFSDHPIGKPLQAQRVLWTYLCPVLTAASVPQGVKVTPLLSVPPSWRDTWATARPSELMAAILSDRESYVSPAPGDLRAPFGLAVAATRQAGKECQASRIVVLGMGPSLSDGYIDQRIPQMAADKTITFLDPPRANADLVINSVYWLIGRQRFIAKGPAQVQPIAMMSDTTRRILWGACVIGLPLVILAAGVIVLVVRRI